MAVQLKSNGTLIIRSLVASHLGLQTNGSKSVGNYGFGLLEPDD